MTEKKAPLKRTHDEDKKDDSEEPPARKRAPTYHAVVHFDGACRGNGTPDAAAGIGAVIEIDGQVRETWKYIGKATNNEAEYGALHMGLSIALADGAKTVTCIGDSKLVIEQMKGAYEVKAPNLKTWHVRCKEKTARLNRVTFEHVPREKNTEADKLANRAIDTKNEGQIKKWI